MVLLINNVYIIYHHTDVTHLTLLKKSSFNNSDYSVVKVWISNTTEHTNFHQLTAWDIIIFTKTFLHCWVSSRCHNCFSAVAVDVKVPLGLCGICLPFPSLPSPPSTFGRYPFTLGSGIILFYCVVYSGPFIKDLPDNDILSKSVCCCNSAIRPEGLCISHSMS